MVCPRRREFGWRHGGHQVKIIARMFGGHGAAVRKIERQPGRTSGQVRQGHHGHRTESQVSVRSALQGGAARAEYIDAERGFGVDELQEVFPRRVVRMDVAEQKVGGEAGGDGVESGRDEIDIVESARAARVVILDGQSAGERPATNIVAHKLAEGAFQASAVWQRSTGLLHARPWYRFRRPTRLQSNRMARMATGVAARMILAVLFLQAQDGLKLLDRAKAHTDYSFPIRTGGEPFRFHVELDETMTVTGVSVFRGSESRPFQTLPMCKGISEQLNEYDSELALLDHADLNFDGFEDVELLQFFHPHLGTKVFCIFTWDNKSARFQYAPAVPNPNPVAHPENKTITVHQDWMGGAYADTIYHWTGGKYAITESSGRGYAIDDPNKCHFVDHCEKLIRGKLVTTLMRPVMCGEDDDIPALECPASARKAGRNVPKPRRGK